MTYTVSSKMNKFVICNPEKCMGCYTCMASCFQSAKERGKVAKPRVYLVHTFEGTMPNQCRHCEDAPCANVCPVGALKFGEDSIEIFEEICIGCKMCVMVCPFGAIWPEAEPIPSIDYLFEPPSSRLLGNVDGEKTVAVKCDLCKGREEGPACVEACPTGALIFVTPDEMERGLLISKSGKSVAEMIQFIKGPAQSMPARSREKTTGGDK